MTKKDTPRTTWDGNVILADFGRRRRSEAAAPGQSAPAPAAQGAESWAGSQLLEAVTRATDRGRLERGREYYRNGHVQSMELSTNTVVGLVSGSQLEPFEVTIRLAPLSAKRREFIGAEVAADPALLRTIMRGDAPPVDIATMLFRHDQVRFEGCSCPDRQPACKHAVAVAYQMAEKLNREPAAVLRWRGIDASEALRQAQAATGPAGRDGSGREAEQGSGEAVGSGQREPELLDQEEFWGSEDRRVRWPELAPASGLELGDRDALMRALRSLSWTSVDQLQTMHELEVCLEAIMDDTGRFEPTPWLPQLPETVAGSGENWNGEDHER